MEDHGRFDYSPIIDRAPVALPDGARIAVWVVPDIEHFHYDKPGMSICIHPFLIGHPFRCKYLDEALAHIKGHDGVWWARGHEIVDRWRGQAR
jgi:hypothetical protein